MPVRKEVKQQHHEFMVNGRHNKPKLVFSADGKTTQHLSIRGISERLEEEREMAKLMAEEDKYWENLLD